MALKTTYENAQDIPEGMETLYTEGENGSFLLGEVEGMVDKGRLDEFRENNIQLRKEIEFEAEATKAALSKFDEQSALLKTLEEKFSSIDMEEWNNLQSDKKAMADKQLLEAGEVDTLIAQRVEEVLAVKAKEFDLMRSDYEKKVSGLETNITSYDSQLSTMLVDNEITRFATEQGVRASALEDVLHRGRGMFRVEDGQAAAFDTNGRRAYGADAVTPLTISAWLGDLTESAPHLFEASTGAGAVQQVRQTTPTAREEPTSTHDLLMAGLANIGME